MLTIVLSNDDQFMDNYFTLLIKAEMHFWFLYFEPISILVHTF